MTQIDAPASNPCGSCPYRCDVPSGVWATEEYEKLPDYDRPTQEQPATVFLCHQQNGRLCAGWVGCHDMNENLGLRISLAMGLVTPDVYVTTQDYVSTVPLFSSGAEAAEHGVVDIEEPNASAQRVIAKLMRRQESP